MVKWSYSEKVELPLWFLFGNIPSKPVVTTSVLLCIAHLFVIVNVFGYKSKWSY